MEKYSTHFPVLTANSHFVELGNEWASGVHSILVDEGRDKAFDGFEAFIARNCP